MSEAHVTGFAAHLLRAGVFHRHGPQAGPGGQRDLLQFRIQKLRDSEVEKTRRAVAGDQNVALA